MTDHTSDQQETQPASVRVPTAQAALSEMLLDAQHFRTSERYLEMLEFTARMRHLAPFNAMLLRLQKPGIRFAATAADWRRRFDRSVREGARPLLILIPFGPVMTVYDIVDTEGESVPEDALISFTASGDVSEAWIEQVKSRLLNRNVEVLPSDAGDGLAGYIRVRSGPDKKGMRHYRMLVNRSHPPAVRLATMAHEIAHLYLGHLGPDRPLAIGARLRLLTRSQAELEAESAAFVACRSEGLETGAAKYLAGYVDENATIDGIDPYRVMLAAGRVRELIKRP